MTRVQVIQRAKRTDPLEVRDSRLVCRSSQLNDLRMAGSCSQSAFQNSVAAVRAVDGLALDEARMIGSAVSLSATASTPVSLRSAMFEEGSRAKLDLVGADLEDFEIRDAFNPYPEVVGESAFLDRDWSRLSRLSISGSSCQLFKVARSAVELNLHSCDLSSATLYSSTVLLNMSDCLAEFMALVDVTLAPGSRIRYTSRDSEAYRSLANMRLEDCVVPVEVRNVLASAGAEMVRVTVIGEDD